jgi:hypothetical protein
LLAYYRETELSKQLGWFHEVVQGTLYSAAYLGDDHNYDHCNRNHHQYYHHHHYDRRFIIIITIITIIVNNTITTVHKLNNNNR